MNMNETTIDEVNLEIDVAVADQDTTRASHFSNEMLKWRHKAILPLMLLKGTRGMIAAGRYFLPQHTLESTPMYKARLLTSTLFNVFAKTINFLTGQVFQVDIVLSDKVTDTHKEWFKDMDSKGTSLNSFARKGFFSALGKGVIGVLVDLPRKTKDVRSKKDEKEAGIRPYFKLVQPESILGGVVDEEGNLIGVRLKESRMVSDPKNPFSNKKEELIRFVEKGKWTLYKVDGGKDVLIDSGEYEKDVLPFLTFVPGERESCLSGDSPLMDLAFLNSKHWRTSSDQDNILHIARVAILFSRFLDLEEVDVSSRAIINSDNENSDLKYVEHSGQAIAAGKEDIKETEASMSLYGLQQLVPRSGNMTATEKKLNNSESSSSLGVWSTEYQSFMNDCLVMGSHMMGDNSFPVDGLQLNHEFNLGAVDPQELQSILKSEEQGIITAQVAFEEIQRRGTFSEKIEWSDMEEDREKERLETEDFMNSTFNQNNNQK